VTGRPGIARVGAVAERFAPRVAAARGRLFRRKTQRCGRTPFVTGKVRVLRVDDTQLVLGDYVFLFDDVRLGLRAPGAVIAIGDETYLSPRSEVSSMASVTIGRRCAIGPEVVVRDNDEHWLAGRPMSAPVTIGDDVWICARAMILKGVAIGDGAVVGAGAVVTSDVPPRSLVAGVPAKVIREEVSWK
jgi:acetyltransferase-like isoleucine patch superfamily enzyme